MEFVFERVENIVGKDKNAGNPGQHFLLFPKCFQKVFICGGRQNSGLFSKGKM